MRFVVMTFGYAILLLIRDPFTNYIQNLVLDRTDKDKQTLAMTMLNLSRKIVHLLSSAAIVASVNISSLYNAVFLLVAISLISELLGGMIYVLIARKTEK